MENTDNEPTKTKSTGFKAVHYLVLAGLAFSALFLVKNEFDKNAKALQSTIKKLDGKPTQIFTSVADCKAKGFSENECDCSFKKAEEISKDTTVAWNYASKEECAANHELYVEKPKYQSTAVGAGGIYASVTKSSVSYYPSMIAWQADSTNICDAVPLYSTTTPDSAVRFDGKKFALNK